MKRIHTLFSYLILFVLLLTLSSCADHRVASIPTDTRFPPEQLPQIGTPTPKMPDKTPYLPKRPKAVDTMITKAKKELDRKLPEAAFQTLERALSIDGQDPMIWHLMAKAREMQGEFHQAESLARKSNSLVRSNPRLTKKNWLLIADVLEKQGYIQEAEAARLK
ncbi:conserved exported hypothetical protein [Desulfamplus magnetovallimortis]|uniref:Tetratricopeptide repeat protein n=1 Tax=Desulfamplus magnetovallimortis TaxID=1246637 RepID=A0A1W1H631_9BACT|nr:hypothetical protein [Desulfamplus magnetovallimortis]SLM27845.1 conserved exported hypothetical protein [Desulfamplus magnetovallimortis]